MEEKNFYYKSINEKKKKKKGGGGINIMVLLFCFTVVYVPQVY